MPTSIQSSRIQRPSCRQRRACFAVFGRGWMESKKWSTPCFAFSSSYPHVTTAALVHHTIFCQRSNYYSHSWHGLKVARLENKRKKTVSLDQYPIITIHHQADHHVSSRTIQGQQRATSSFSSFFSFHISYHHCQEYRFFISVYSARRTLPAQSCFVLDRSSLASPSRLLVTVQSYTARYPRVLHFSFSFFLGMQSLGLLTREISFGG